MTSLTYPRRPYIKKAKIETLLKTEFDKNGAGITIEDLMSNFHTTKKKAQRSLKHLHEKRFVFTAHDLKKQGINIEGFTRKKPQEYYLTSMKSQIIETRKKNVLNYTTSTRPSRMGLLRAQSFQDILVNLYANLLYIHNMQLETVVKKEYYKDLDEKPEGVNKVKIVKERIGFAKVFYNLKVLVYPNGTVMIHIVNSENPFRILDESDVIHIMTFLGRVEDRLHHIFNDPRDRIVSPVRHWILKECDVNKDIKIDGVGQLTLHKIQIPLVDKALRGYVKIINGESNYRVEFSVYPNEKVGKALDQIRTGVKIDKNSIRPNN